MRRGAFTLIEILIVVALVVAISAVALPSLASRVVAGRAGHAVRSLESAATLTRAEAMTRGVLMTLVAERSGDEWVLLARPIDAALAANAGGAGDATPDLPEEPPEKSTEFASFSGVALTDVLSDPGGGLPADDAIMPDGLPEALGEFSDGTPPPATLTIGTFFPDGSCRAGAPLYILAPDGSRQVVRLRPLTGRLDVRALPTLDEEARLGNDDGDSQPLLPMNEEGAP